MIEHKTCCCCGAATIGEQWHNRDLGYGMCESCIVYVRSKGMSDTEILDLYGVKGVHGGVRP